MDVLDHAGLAFPQSLPEFQQLFPDDAACARYLEKARWAGGFLCPHCRELGEPFRIATRPGILTCRKCRRQTGLTAGTVMERSHTPLSIWLGGLSGRQPDARHVRRAVSTPAWALALLQKLRAAMVRPNQDRIGDRSGQHVEVDETWVGGRMHGEGRGVHHKVLVTCAVEVRHRKPGNAHGRRKDGRVRFAVASDRSAEQLCGFVESAVESGTLTVTDDWSGYASVRKRGYDHHAIAECDDPEVAEEFLPIVHLVFSNLKTWLTGVHHCVSASICKLTSTSSHSASVGAFTLSMPSARCSGSPSKSTRRLSARFIQESGGTLHLVDVCLNRIGTHKGTRAIAANSTFGPRGNAEP